MKKNYINKYFAIVSFLLLFLVSFNFSFADDGWCYPDGCIKNVVGDFGQFGPSNFTTAEAYMKTAYNAVIGWHGQGGSNFTYDTDGTVIGISCHNGSYGGFWERKPTCKNGASNPPACDQCGTGSTMTNNQCTCNNGASNPPSCSTCPSGATLYNNLCVCSNGATNMPACDQCPAGATMTAGQCVCSNDADPKSGCNECPAGKAMSGGRCYDACDLTAVCGITVQGVMKNGTCSTTDDSDPNASCISDFKFNTDSVNPNGDVDFSWKLNDKIPSTIGSRCGFYDLTDPNAPRAIPGLQNLDPKISSQRISNIQSTTRFCLICQFYNLVNNNILGNAAQHQWIRVIKVGEQ